MAYSMLDQTVYYMQDTAMSGNWNVFSILGLLVFVSVIALYFKRKDLYERLVNRDALLVAFLVLVASAVFGGVPLALGKLTGYANMFYQLILSGVIGYVFAVIFIEGPRMVYNTVVGAFESFKK